MPDARMVLTAMQHADSFFPSGGIGFSWGLEGLANDGRVGRRNFGSCVMGQLLRRWACFDRVFTAHAHGAQGDFHALGGIDGLQEAGNLSREQRRGSRNAGRALLLAHDRLGTRFAHGFRELVLEGRMIGHLSTVQGLAAYGLGMDLETALMVSGYCSCAGLLGAAIRLGLVPNLDTQILLQRLLDRLAAILEQPVPALEEAGSYAPEMDVAMMRHERQDGRLFAN